MGFSYCCMVFYFVLFYIDLGREDFSILSGVEKTLVEKGQAKMETDKDA